MKLMISLFFQQVSFQKTVQKYYDLLKYMSWVRKKNEIQLRVYGESAGSLLGVC